MARYNPKQKFITVNKTVDKNENNKYVFMVVSVMEEAAQNLGAGSFKLWCYFMKNQNGYNFGLSSSDAKEKFGMGRSQYDSAVEELQKKGYLIEVGHNVYQFFDVAKPNNEKSLQENNTSKQQKIVVIKDNNENFVDLKPSNEIDVVKQYNEDFDVVEYNNEKDNSMQENITTKRVDQNFDVLKQNNVVVLKSNNETPFSLQENNTRNIINNTINNNITGTAELGGSITNPIPMHTNWFKVNGGASQMVATNRRDIFIFEGKYYIIDDTQNPYKGIF